MFCWMLSKHISFKCDPIFSMNCLLVLRATENKAGADDALAMLMQVVFRIQQI
jgi:hypothetical protein